MHIAYYMPLKPLGHSNPSGDLVFGTELYSHLIATGHDCQLASRLRCRWIYRHPLRLLKMLHERSRVVNALQRNPADIWLSYHSYYKAPDMLGPYCAKKLKIPYVIFQGIYSTKRRRSISTMPGFMLNRQALLAADLVFTNKHNDYKNLGRLLSTEKLCYVAPGIVTADFRFNPEDRQRQRAEWGLQEDTVVIMAAAMFRPGVKTRGLEMVIQACAELKKKGRPVKLVIAGDGKSRDSLHRLGRNLLADSIIFTGKVPRSALPSIYSGADIFAFPGIEESLGMVYLEAQSCGLPVVAFSDWGSSEAVVDKVTGLLCPFASPERFTCNIDRLVEDARLRRQLGNAAREHVRSNHELAAGYAVINSRLNSLLHSSNI